MYIYKTPNEEIYSDVDDDVYEDQNVFKISKNREKSKGTSVIQTFIFPQNVRKQFSGQ